MTQPDSADNSVRRRRLALGLSQQDLAERAGISRTAVSAIEGARLSPSVTAALALARTLDVTVEELFGSQSPAAGIEWAWPPPHDGWRYYQAEVAGRRLLFPLEQTECRADSHDGLATSMSDVRFDDDVARQTLVLATCDPAANLLACEYQRRTGLRLLVTPRSSQQALDLLGQGRIHLAGIHFSSSGAESANANRVQTSLGAGYRLLRAASWQAGIAVSPSVSGRSVTGLIRSRPEWIGREAGSAARHCLDRLTHERQPIRHVALSHRSVADAIRSGWGEAGVCVQLVAEETRLRFLPVQSEAYDLCFAAALEADHRFRQLLTVMRSPSYRQRLVELPGYSSAETGAIASW